MICLFYTSRINKSIMKYLIIFCSLVSTANALFLPRLMEEFSSIKNIISSRAIVSSITEKVNSQIISDDILLSELTHPMLHPAKDVFYFAVFATSFIIQNQLVHAKNKKWLEIETYTNMKKITNNIIFIILIVLTKGVENAI